MFNQQEFNDFILANGIIKTFNEPITLKSGKSRTYTSTGALWLKTPI